MFTGFICQEVHLCCRFFITQVNIRTHLQCSYMYTVSAKWCSLLCFARVCWATESALVVKSWFCKSQKKLWDCYGSVFTGLIPSSKHWKRHLPRTGHTWHMIVFILFYPWLAECRWTQLFTLTDFVLNRNRDLLRTKSITLPGPRPTRDLRASMS